MNMLDAEHCSKKTCFVMEDVMECAKKNDFTGLEEKVFWRMYASFQDGYVKAMIELQEKRCVHEENSTKS